MWTSGQHVWSLEVRADRQQVVHRIAFTLRAPSRIALSTPVSQAACGNISAPGQRAAR